jgi:hypothetical protein
MRNIRALFVAATCAVAVTATALAAAVQYDLSPPGAASLRPFGFVTSLSIDGHSMAADMMAQLPTGSGITPAPAAGVLTHFEWSGGVASPLDAKFTASVLTADKIKALILDQTSKSVPIDEHVTIYSYNQLKKAWYVAFDCTLNGAAQKLGDVPQLKVSGTTVETDVVPTTSSSTCTINDGNGPIIKPIGLKVP